MKKSIIAICLVVLTGWMVQSQTANNIKASAVRGKKCILPIALPATRQMGVVCQE